MDTQFILLALLILSIQLVLLVPIGYFSFISSVGSIIYTKVEWVKFYGRLVSVRYSEFGIRDSV